MTPITPLTVALSSGTRSCGHTGCPPTMTSEFDRTRPFLGLPTNSKETADSAGRELH